MYSFVCKSFGHHAEMYVFLMTMYVSCVGMCVRETEAEREGRRERGRDREREMVCLWVCVGYIQHRYEGQRSPSCAIHL